MFDSVYGGKTGMLQSVNDEIANSISEAFAQYGKKVRAFGPQRQHQIAKLLKYYDPESLVHAVHGYRWIHRGRFGDHEDLDMTKWHTPDTVFRISNIDKYIDAYHEAVEAGEEPPFTDEIRPKAQVPDAWANALSVVK